MLRPLQQHPHPSGSLSEQNPLPPCKRSRSGSCKSSQRSYHSRSSGLNGWRSGLRLLSPLVVVCGECVHMCGLQVRRESCRPWLCP